MNVAQLPITVDTNSISDFCVAHGIISLSLFGSVLREDFRPKQSDLDVLVKFAPDRSPGWEFYTWDEELTKILVRKVDLHTPLSLSPYFREEVLKEALPIYEQK